MGYHLHRALDMYIHFRGDGRRWGLNARRREVDFDGEARGRALDSSSSSLGQGVSHCSPGSTVIPKVPTVEKWKLIFLVVLVDIRLVS